MKRLLIAASVLFVMNSAALAEPVKLTDTQMDRIAAGTYTSSSSYTSTHTSSRLSVTASSTFSKTVTINGVTYTFNYPTSR